MNNSALGTVSELLLCPFCGGKAETQCTAPPHSDWFVLCGECGASAPVFNGDKLDGWNIRAQPAAQAVDEDAERRKHAFQKWYAANPYGELTNATVAWMAYHEGAKMERAALAAPVHQWSDDEGVSWCDGNENSMASARAAGWPTRTLYAAPVQSEQEPVGVVTSIEVCFKLGIPFQRKVGISTTSVGHKILERGDKLYAAPVRAVRMPDPLAAFAIEIINGSYEGGGLDACNIQDMAVRHGLLRIEERDGPCRPEGCACAEYGFPSECYRHTDVMKDAVARLNGEQP